MSAWKIQLLYDGDCPLCVKEVNFLRQKDAGRGLVDFVDIADLDYNPDEHQSIDYQTAMGQIHAILADGTVITNIEVFRQVYTVLGMGWIYNPTRLPVIRQIADWMYLLWAKLRLPLTHRPPIDVLIQQRRLCQEEGNCEIRS